MNELADLAHIIHSRGQANLPLLDFESAAEAKEWQLIQALATNPDVSQNKLIREIYGEINEANTEAFWQLRTRLQSKLLNHLYFLDNSDPRHLVSRRYEMAVLQILHQAVVLVEEGENNLAIQRLRRCLLLAEQDDFLHYAVSAARHLRNLYANARKPALYRELTAKFRALTHRLALENEAEELYMDIRNDLTGTIRTRRALVRKLGGIVAKLKQLHKKANTASTATFYYRARLTQQELLGNFNEILRIANQAAEQLRTTRLNAHRFDVRYNYYMTVYALLRLRRVDEGLKRAAEYLSSFHPSSNNWFAFQENHVLLALYAGRYDLALEVQESVLLNALYKRQLPAARERWDLYDAYLDFLVPRIPSPGQKRFRQWAMALPDFNRDKRGYHVAILILQFLYYLRERNLDEVTVRLERLRKYQQLHLREDVTLRSRLFLRLLAILTEKSFEPLACTVRGLTLLARLRDIPQPGEAYAQIEIVPYEALWAITLQLLSQGPPLPAPVGEGPVGP